MSMEGISVWETSRDSHAVKDMLLIDLLTHIDLDACQELLRVHRSHGRKNGDAKGS